MVTKEVLQKFVDDHIDMIGEVVSGGIKNKDGKWMLICPMMERFNLDFSKLDKKPEFETEEVSKKKKSTKKKK